MTKLKHPHIKGMTVDIDESAVAEWVAAGWQKPAERKPVEQALKNSATAENTENKEQK